MLHVGSLASNTNISREDTAAFYNKSYTSVGPSLPKNFAEDCFYYGRKVNEDMEIPFTDAEEVITICREINVMKSSRMAKLSSRIYVRMLSWLYQTNWFFKFYLTVLWRCPFSLSHCCPCQGKYLKK